MKNHVITVRLTKELKEDIEYLAEQKGMTISEYIRDHINSRFHDVL
jgi:predicted DNA-binding protein